MIELYRKTRRNFFERFPDFWFDFHGQEYALHGVHIFTKSEIDEIQQAASAVGWIYQKVGRLLRTLPNETLLQLGVPKAALEVSRITIPGMGETVIGRLDMVKTRTGYKVLEFNADTPTFIVETFEINGKVCEYFQVADPNHNAKLSLSIALDKAIVSSINYLHKNIADSAYVVFTSCGDHQEDRETTKFLLNLVTLPKHICQRYADVATLQIDGNGLYDADGNKIDVLYRLYPLEYFVSDANLKTGIKVGEVLFDLVKQKKLALINPPSAFLLQSKAVQAVIWGLYENHVLFNEDECSVIEKYLLPTYLDPLSNEKYVVKPVYGREGDTVHIVEPGSNATVESLNKTYAEQVMVYQKYVDMPSAEFMTEKGPQLLHMLMTCFLVNGCSMGVGMRVGGTITDNLSYFAPICVGN